MAKKDQGEVTTLTVVGDGAVDVEQVDHEAVRARVRDLRTRVEQDGWELSEALFEVHRAALYQVWGFASWKDYVEKELEFRQRKADYFVSTQAWVRLFAPDFVQWVRAMGLSKARLMCNRVLPETAATWRARLDGKTYREMEMLLSGQDPDDDGSDGDGDGGDGEGSEGGSGAGGEKAEAVRFMLYPAQKSNVMLAVERAKVQAQTDVDGHALDLICTDFLAGSGHFRTTAEHLANVERALGVRLVAFAGTATEAGKRSIVYGSDFMNDLMDELGEDGVGLDGDDADDDDEGEGEE